MARLKETEFGIDRAGLGRLTDRAAAFAGEPAPTGTAPVSSVAQTLWERVYPRRGRHSHRISTRPPARCAPSPHFAIIAALLCPAGVHSPLGA
ncbi:conserved protein of unknown function [Pseudomonas inefficax]|uniref:Uncharacterized protein n=1 Tax=Pseudomonas inefficax TaxID=2078786 RepID=A0AAQ1SSI3_9PSED|nr:conserved protein of unknown function [Pseudomonas inefficax]